MKSGCLLASEGGPLSMVALPGRSAIYCVVEPFRSPGPPPTSLLAAKMAARGHARRDGRRHQRTQPREPVVVIARRCERRKRTMSGRPAIARPLADGFFAATLAEGDPEVAAA